MGNGILTRAEKLSRVICAFAAMLMLTDCGADGSVRIGFVAGTSGRVADLGLSGRDAAELAVEQCNRSGGIHGRNVILLFRDDKQDPEIARQAVAGLIHEGVAAIIGPMTSDMAIAVTPLANASKVVLVSPTATTEALSGKDDYFFRTTGTTRVYAEKSARYNFFNSRMRRLSAAYDTGNLSFSENWLDNFRKTYTALGGTVATVVAFASGGKLTFLEIAHALLADRPDGILIIANSMDSALLCQQIRKLDQTGVSITLSDWGATERLLELGGRAVEGVTVVQAFDRDSQAPRYRAFRKAFQVRYHREPGFPGVNTYNATQVVLAAIDAREKGKTLKETLLTMGVHRGLQNDFSFDEFGDVVQPAASISIVKNHRFVVVE